MIATQNAEQIGRFDKNHQTLQDAVPAAQPNNYTGADGSRDMAYAGYTRRHRIHYPEDAFIAAEGKNAARKSPVFAGIACDYHDEDAWLWRHA